MAPHHEVRQSFILFWVHGIADHAEDVEPREDGFGELDVLGKGDGAIVAPSDRIRGGDDGAAGLERSDDASFGDGDGLLFHGFVDGGAVLVVHLVELIDETGAPVCEHERTTFECPFCG